MNVVLTVVLALQMLAALGMIGLILVQQAKALTWARLLAAAAQEVCLEPVAVPTFCRVVLAFWRLCFSSARCSWPILAMLSRVPGVPVFCRLHP